MTGITAVSRIPESMEAWWIGPDGAIETGYWYEGMPEWERRKRFPAGSAVPAGIAAVSRKPETMEVWWIAPDESVQAGYWYEGMPEWASYDLDVIAGVKPTPAEQRIIDLANEERARVGGCAPVQLEPRLLRAARAHSLDLATHPNLYNAPPPPGRPSHPGHYGSDGSLGWDEGGIQGRIGKAMNASGWQGENVAWGYPNADAAFSAWFNETPPNDGHRRNILNCDFKFIGVGIAHAADGTPYYTQDFFG